MPEVNIEFKNLHGIDAEITYSREPEGSGRLKVRFSSEKMLYDSGTRRTFGLDFNAIGKTNPEVFLASLDEGYLDDKVSGLSRSRHDFFKTVMNIRKMADDPDYELTATQRIEVDAHIDEITKAFDGNHSLYSKILIDGLRYFDLPCFLDDVYHLAGHRKTPENIRFHMEVWPDFQDALFEFLDANMDIYDEIEAIVKGRDVPTASEEEMEP